MSFDYPSYLLGQQDGGGGGGFGPSDEGKVVQNGALVAQTDETVTVNGVVDTTTIKQVAVNVQPPAPIEPKDVNFFDYDGTCLYAYSAAEFANLTEMPANPTHEGWTSQGWNWTLTDAKAYAASYGFLDIGQMYVPTDGKTHIHFTLDSAHLKPYLGFGLDGTATINWGDGSAEETVTGTNAGTLLKFPHEYAEAGEHEITIALASGVLMAIMGGSAANEGSDLLGDNVETTSAANFYRKNITAVEIGSGSVLLRNYSFTKCSGLKTLTIPSQINTSYTGFLKECGRIRFFCLPSQFSGMGDCNTCSSLTRVSFSPAFAGNMPSYCFNECRNLESVSIPPLVTSTGNSVFNNCTELKRAVLSEGFTTVGDKMFLGCYSLLSLTLPSTVATIAGNAFGSCYDLQTITFKSTTPPTVSNSNAFGSLPTDCVIRVPSASLNTYKTATNYPDPNTYTYVGY